MSKAFRPYEPEQTFLMPASMKEWLPSDHLAYFIGGKHFIQAYNAQAAVDSFHQIIVAAETTNKPTDRGQAEPMMEKVKENTGRLPHQMSTDTGYFSSETVTALSLKARHPASKNQIENDGLSTFHCMRLLPGMSECQLQEVTGN